MENMKDGETDSSVFINFRYLFYPCESIPHLLHGKLEIAT